ncbi:hypothetical protein SK128_014037 [Halocaridina rubra]|uniref:Uncharacterized protein n=1 Tax=Halocaridina rubra TaxID=373956 RepID=A0AAN8XHE4_HALRR
MSHTCYNPLILFWLNIKFREGFLNVLQRLLPCLRPRISRYLLMTRRSVVGLRRDHASNTITGSSRVSVSNRHLADPRARRLSLFADQVFAPQPRSVEIPLTEIRSNFYNYSTDKNGTTNNRERKYSEPLPGHYTYALPAGASDQEPSPFWRMSFFNSPRTAISQEF